MTKPSNKEDGEALLAAALEVIEAQARARREVQELSQRILLSAGCRLYERLIGQGKREEAEKVRELLGLDEAVDPASFRG